MKGVPRTLASLVVASTLALGAALAGAADVDFDPKAPFERYKTWAFVPDRDKDLHGVFVDPTARERIEKALTERLKRAGLQPVGAGEDPDVLLRYQGDVGTGKTIETSAGALANWSDPGYATTQFQEQTATLIVDLIDAGTKTLAWRLYVNQKFGGPNDQRGKVRKAIDEGFEKYPPSESARAKKLRELEKQKSR